MSPSSWTARRRGSLDVIDVLVFKPRNGAGARGVGFGGDVPAAGKVAQPRIELPTQPTITGHRPQPRRVDLRAFAVRTSTGYVVLPGVSRFAVRAHEPIVNTTHGGR